MPSSKISIANSAILKVGGTVINSFDDNKTEAVIVQEFYDRSVSWLLAQHYWGFSMVTKQLAQTVNPPNHEYQYAYALPNGYVRIQRVFPNCDYKIVGNEIHTNQSEIAVKFTDRVDESTFPIYFEQTLMYYLASQICVPLTENSTKEVNNFNQYHDHLKRAKSLDSQQYPQNGFEDLTLDNSRYGGGIYED